MPANTGVAPICNAKAEEPNFFTQPPRIPHFGIPAANGVSAIPGIISALQQLQNAVNQITTSGPPQNNVPQIQPGGGQGGQLGGTDKHQQQQPGEWEVTARATQNVKVVNPDDDSQFVIVKETISITVQNSTTGQQIVLNLVQ